jgi:hypothetical protein
MRISKSAWSFTNFLTVVLLLAMAGGLWGETPDERTLREFADPSRVWGVGVEADIERAYRLCFRTFVVGERVITVRLPFAENHERDALIEGGWEFIGKGKSDPAALWPTIETTFASADFALYIAALSDGREKVVMFDIPLQRWSVSEDIFDIARMRAGSYHGLPHKPYVLVSGTGARERDVYNYLYCIAWTGMDCSGFVWHTLSFIAGRRGVNLGEYLAKRLRLPAGVDPSYYMGTSFYNSRSAELEAVEARVRNLRPADIILFRASDGSMAHSAIIQSVNFATGVIRYLQETDEAPQRERGAHESFIFFDPMNTDVHLSDTSLVWSQKRYSAFPGEKESAFSDDGARYRAFSGGRVVRLRVLK